MEDILAAMKAAGDGKEVSTALYFLWRDERTKYDEMTLTLSPEAILTMKALRVELQDKVVEVEVDKAAEKRKVNRKEAAKALKDILQSFDPEDEEATTNAIQAIYINANKLQKNGKQ
jgi:hypothetical protein